MDSRHVLLSALKKAEDGDCAILRLVNMHDRRIRCKLRSRHPIASAARTNLLERPNGRLAVEGGHVIGLSLRPHEIATVALELRPFSASTACRTR